MSDRQSCAFGNLPCPHNPNGRLPCLAQPDIAGLSVATDTSGLRMQPGTARDAPQVALTAADAVRPTFPAEAVPTKALPDQNSLYPDALSAFAVVVEAEPNSLKAMPFLLGSSRIQIL